jgi:hypothetical protein
MNIRNIVLTFGFLTASVGIAQGPLYDRVTVTLPYPVSVNGTVLQPGDYEIRQHESTAGGSRIVHFFKDGGMKLETTAMAIPTLDNRTPDETKLVLDRFGSDYYLNKIWVQGKDYGYEFPIPDSVRMRENERSTAASLTGTYQAAPATTETQTTTTTTERTETAQVTPPPEPAPAPAEAAPAPAPQAEVTPAPAPAPETTPAPMAADRPAQTMPATAGDWLNLLLGGGLLASSGLALRRFRA